MGYPLPRSTIANIESGRKAAIAVQEIAVIARALGTSPISLLYDVESNELVEICPGLHRLPIEAVEWFSGMWPILQPDPGLSRFSSFGEWLHSVTQGDEDARPDRGGHTALEPIALYRQHAKLETTLWSTIDRLAEVEVAVEDIERGEVPVQALFDPVLRSRPTSYWVSLRDQYRSMVAQNERDLEHLRKLMESAGIKVPPLRGVLRSTRPDSEAPDA